MIKFDRYLTQWMGSRRELKIPVLTLSSALAVCTTSPVLAQASPVEPGGLQTHLSEADHIVLEALYEVAEYNSPEVRDAQGAMGITPFMDVITFEVVPKNINTYTTDGSIPESGTYLYRESGTDFNITFNPMQLISAFQQQPALQAHARSARQQVHFAVLESYITYLQASQSADIAQRQFDTVVASLPQTQIASSSLTPYPLLESSSLMDHPDYVVASTQLFGANTDELMALETLALTVGLSATEILDMIAERQASLRPAQSMPNNSISSNDVGAASLVLD
jgi:hypothetical protein